MKDWNNIRKSDEEFMQDIYEKAKLYQEQSIDEVSNLGEFKQKTERKNKQRVTKMISMGVSAAAACTLVILSAVNIFPHWKHDDTTTSPENSMYRSMDEPDVVQYSVDEEVSPVESEPIEVMGTVADITEDSNGVALTVTVDNQDVSGLENQVQVILSEDLYEKLQEYGKEHKLQTFKGMPVILYIETYNWLDYYKVINNDSFYLQEVTQDGAILYKNLDGDILDN